MSRRGAGWQEWRNRGSCSPEVVDLQYLLHFRSPVSVAALGGFDGDFGPKTEQAVRDFQATRGITVDGVVGAQTWSTLVPKPPGPPAWPRLPGEFLRQGDQGPDVLRLQQGLNLQGFDAGPEDGDFEPRTRAAVIRSQRSGVPVSNQEGVLGPLTWGSSIADRTACEISSRTETWIVRSPCPARRGIRTDRLIQTCR